MQSEALSLTWKQAVALAFVLLIAGCSSMPRAPATVASRSDAAARPGTAVLLPAANSGRGGYYKDDGPGEQIPEGLENTPDAEPRIEAYSSRANRPYTQFGKEYVPITDNRPFRQQGIGSWYGKKFHGNKTSSGEPYDMYRMTAAHPTLPIPSYVRVTNLENGRQIIVRVNDRGPFHSDRIIDLSYTAALKLGYLGRGSNMLEVEHLLPDEIERLAKARERGAAPPVALAQGNAVAVGAQTYPVLPVALFEEKSAEKALPAAPPATAATAAGGYYLQLGAFTQTQNAQAMRERHARTWADRLPQAEIVQSGVHYRLYVGPFGSREQADDAAQRLEQAGVSRPMVVKR